MKYGFSTKITIYRLLFQVVEIISDLFIIIVSEAGLNMRRYKLEPVRKYIKTANISKLRLN